MICVELPAAMECVEEGCGVRLGIRLALTAGGTMIGRPPHGHGWQIAVMENGVLVCRCPKHHQQIERVSPVIGARH